MFKVLAVYALFALGLNPAVLYADPMTASLAFIRSVQSTTYLAAVEQSSTRRAKVQEDVMSTAGILYFTQIAVSQAGIRLVADQTSKAVTTVIEEDKRALSNAQLVESEQAALLVDVTV